MYNKFNKFLDRETWYKGHPTDNDVFYRILAEVISNEDFSPDEMADYMTSYLKIENDKNPDFSRSIERLRGAAWHIGDYLKCIKKF